jgi:hypothetical protein
MAEHKGNGRVTGTVTRVSDAKLFDLKTQKQATIQKDFYHLFLKIKNDKTVKIYFPVTANVVESVDKRKGGKKSKGIYSRKSFVKVQGKNGEWIDYQIANPGLLVGKKIEVSGDVTKNDDGSYYMNKILEMKVYTT